MALNAYVTFKNHLKTQNPILLRVSSILLAKLASNPLCSAFSWEFVV